MGKHIDLIGRIIMWPIALVTGLLFMGVVIAFPIVMIVAILATLGVI